MENTALYSYIQDKLNEIFSRILESEFDLSDTMLLSSNLLGMQIGLSPRDFLYLYFEVKNSFDIKIPEQDIIIGKFSSFSSICEIIYRQLDLKEKQVS